MDNAHTWKNRLYQAYISSGQAAIREGNVATEVFQPRKAFISEIIAKHFPSDTASRILDLGCGHGAFLYFLALAGYRNIAGVDISEEQIAAARRLGVAYARQGQFEEILTTSEDSTVDVVLLMDVIEHLETEELFQLLDEARRVLREGGKCVLHCPNADGLYGMGIRYGDLTHRTAFTPKSIRQLLRTVGFSQVTCYEDKPVVHGVLSLVRRCIWAAGTLPHRLLRLAETATSDSVLSQNVLTVAIK
jgi:SAM-dependent methyltransferase